MEPYLRADGAKKFLATLPYSQDIKKHEVFQYEVKNSEKFDLLQIYFTKFSVRLLDEKLEQLNLTSGQPTLLKLTMSPKIEETFLIQADSKLSKNIFLQNTSGDFKNVLPYPIQLDGNWQVALSSIYYPSRCNLAKFMPRNDYFIEFEFSIGIEPFFIEIFFDDGEIYFTRDLVRHINVELNKELVKIKKDYVEFKKENIVAKIQYLGRNEYVFFQSTIEVKATFSKAMAIILGKSLPVNDYAMMITPESEEKKKLNTLGICNLRLIFPHTIIVYLNIIEPIITGNTVSKILKTITFPESTDDIIFYEPNVLEFEKLDVNTIQYIHFELRSITGQILPFRDDGVTVNLFFKKT